MRLSLTLLLALVLLGPVSVAHAAPLELLPPVPGAPVTTFDHAVTRYSAGHRGVDLAARPGDMVRASAAGTVHFVGMVAGRPTVSIDHGGARTTYTPAVGTVARGQSVRRGEAVATVGADAHCLSRCLHWGLTDGTDYWDPLSQLAVPLLTLLPVGTEPLPVPPLLSVHPPGRMPVPGRTTSPFGMRIHPITGVRKLHDGTDIGAPCGTAVTTPWSGRVVSAAFHTAYGYRVILEHDGLRTAYAHLRGLEVRSGDELTSGARLGAVGSTGLSTGCHLHWMAWRKGALVDPLTLAG